MGIDARSGYRVQGTPIAVSSQSWRGRFPAILADGASSLPDRWWPADAGMRAWARCAAAEMHSGFSALRNECSMSCGVRVKLHSQSAALARDIARLNELWSEGLSQFDGPFLAGARFSAVDAFFAPVATRIQTYGLTMSVPAKRYVDLLLTLPAVKDWVEAGIRESWRDAPHEAEIMQSGELLQDLRQ
jgi:glutathione S-transferase